MQEGAAAAQPIPIAGAEDDQILEQVSTSTTFFYQFSWQKAV